MNSHVSIEGTDRFCSRIDCAASPDREGILRFRDEFVVQSPASAALRHCILGSGMDHPTKNCCEPSALAGTTPDAPAIMAMARSQSSQTILIRSAECLESLQDPRVRKGRQTSVIFSKVAVRDGRFGSLTVTFKRRQAAKTRRSRPGLRFRIAAIRMLSFSGRFNFAN